MYTYGPDMETSMQLPGRLKKKSWFAVFLPTHPKRALSNQKKFIASLRIFFLNSSLILLTNNSLKSLKAVFSSKKGYRELLLYAFLPYIQHLQTSKSGSKKRS